MRGKIYLILLLLSGILFQGIIGTMTDDNVGESSDILVRQKRVINRVPGEDRKESILNFPYVVRIKHNNRISCVGAILSLHVAITIASCIRFEVSNYHVFSNSRRTEFGQIHNITSARKRYGGHPNRSTDGIALLIVDPPFEFGSFSNFIQLHTAPLLPGTLGTISGWGHDCLSRPSATMFPKNLRSIEVPIMTHRDCVNIYRPYDIEISDKDICTYHPQKYCGHTDGGAPLVVSGQLVGVHLWTGLNMRPNNPEYPDVFAVVQHPDYSQWIRTNIGEIEAQFVNPHK